MTSGACFLQAGCCFSDLANIITAVILSVGGGIFSPPALMFCAVLFFIICFSDFFRTNYLDIYQTDLHEICRIGRTLSIDELSEVIFSISEGTLPWQPILWAKSTSNTHLV